MSLLKSFMSKFIPEPMSGCWLWEGGTGTFGYGRLQFNGEREYAHRISYESFVGEIPEGMCVLHKCDTPACVNPKHLFLGTQADNMDDMHSKGRRGDHDRVGEANGNSTLSDDSVREIRSLVDGGMSCPKVAAMFGIGRKQAWKIATRRAWSHVT